MRKLTYDVAVSVDGSIAHADGSVDGFLQTGQHVTDYLERLQAYDTVVMGRATYEWGYAFGLVPGKRAYPHMRHYVFSKTLQVGTDAEIEIIRDGAVEQIARLKRESGSDIYLCGGGAFAGFLLERGLIDVVVLKQNPVVIGDGIRLFGASAQTAKLVLESSRTYDNGVVLSRYAVDHAAGSA